METLGIASVVLETGPTAIPPGFGAPLTWPGWPGWLDRSLWWPTQAQVSTWLRFVGSRSKAFHCHTLLAELGISAMFTMRHGCRWFAVFLKGITLPDRQQSSLCEYTSSPPYSQVLDGYVLGRFGPFSSIRGVGETKGRWLWARNPGRLPAV